MNLVIRFAGVGDRILRGGVRLKGGEAEGWRKEEKIKDSLSEGKELRIGF